MIKRAGAARSRALDFPRFLSIMARRMDGEDRSGVLNDIRDAFRIFDRDGDGFLSYAELRHIMTNFDEMEMTAEDIDQTIREADADGDGRISCEEFVDLMVLEDSGSPQ